LSAITIKAITPHTTGRWRIRTQTGRKRKDYYAPTEATAYQRAAALLQEPQDGAADLAELLAAGPGTPEQWEALCWKTARRLADSPGDESLMRLARTLSTLAGAAAKMRKLRPAEAPEYNGPGGCDGGEAGPDDPYLGAPPVEES